MVQYKQNKHWWCTHWSNLATQRLHTLQCLDRNGFLIYHPTRQPIIHLAAFHLQPTKQVKQKWRTSSILSSASSSTALCCFSLDKSFLMNPGSAATALKNANMAVKKVVKNIRLVNSKCEVAVWLESVDCRGTFQWDKTYMARAQTSRWQRPRMPTTGIYSRNRASSTQRHGWALESSIWWCQCV